jgi:hypothetical protein
MIELVIAIVVMGIAMMTLPLMLTTIQKNNNFAMEQEGILAARTKIGDILSYRWDEKSESNVTYTVGVLDTNSSYFKREVNSTRRIGHVVGNRRRKFFNDERNASTTMGLDAGENINNADDIDDFNGDASDVTTVTINEVNNTNSEDYRFLTLDLNTTVRYINDFNNTISVLNAQILSNISFDFNTTTATTTSTNIKMIEVNATVIDTTSTDQNITFTFRTFSCNIGENDLLRRAW